MILLYAPLAYRECKSMRPVCSLRVDVVAPSYRSDILYGVPTLKAFGETVNEIQDKTNLLNRQFQSVFTTDRQGNARHTKGSLVRYVIPVSLSGPFLC
jgi:hypothetical protein